MNSSSRSYLPLLLIIFLSQTTIIHAFSCPSCSRSFPYSSSSSSWQLYATTSTALDDPSKQVEDPTLTSEITRRSERKKLLLGLLGSTKKNDIYVDPILACPFSKTPLEIQTSGPVLGYSSSNMGVRCTLRSQSGCHTFTGRTDTYFNLLEPIQNDDDDDETNRLSEERTNTPLFSNQTINALKPLIPPPIRSILSISGILSGEDYIPMRDLFTSPSVSFAYERGKDILFIKNILVSFNILQNTILPCYYTIIMITIHT